MAWSCTSIGIVIRTVGLVVGTGRGGITRLAAVASGAAVAVPEGPDTGGREDATGHGDDASMSVRGPALSQAEQTHPNIARAIAACRLMGPVITRRFDPP